MKILKVVVILMMLGLISACATSPTGRTQILLYSDAQLAAMGQQAFVGMKSELKMSNKRIENTLVQCIAGYITEQVPKSVFAGEWEVVVFDDEQVNAFALPGGKIGVYTGLLNVAENQHQIAAVIGHEVAHVIARHGNSRMSQSDIANFGKQVALQALEAYQVTQTPAIMQALGLATNLGTLKYGRDDESEADIVGLELMAKAGFKPSAAVELWQNMASLSQGQKPPEFLSTHPSEATRISDLQANLVSAEALYQQTTQKPRCYD